MLHHLSTIARNGQTKHWLKRGLFMCYVSLGYTEALPHTWKGRVSRRILIWLQPATSPLHVTNLTRWFFKYMLWHFILFLLVLPSSSSESVFDYRCCELGYGKIIAGDRSALEQTFLVWDMYKFRN